MKPTDVYSIELNKEKAFEWFIAIKDKDGYTREKIPVPDSNADAIFEKIVSQWLKKCYEEGKSKNGIPYNELQKRRK